MFSLLSPFIQPHNWFLYNLYGFLGLWLLHDGKINFSFDFQTMFVWTGLICSHEKLSTDIIRTCEKKLKIKTESRYKYRPGRNSRPLLTPHSLFIKGVVKLSLIATIFPYLPPMFSKRSHDHINPVPYNFKSTIQKRGVWWKWRPLTSKEPLLHLLY